MKYIALFLFLIPSFSFSQSMRQNGSPSRILGVTDGSSAQAGYVGEIISATSAGQNPGASGTWVAIATLTLTAGDWDIMGMANITDGGTTSATEASSAISTSNTTPDVSNVGNRTIFSISLGANSNAWTPAGCRTVSISATTTYYLIGSFTYATLGGASWQNTSHIFARRVR